MSQHPQHLSWRATAVMLCLWATTLSWKFQICRGLRETSAAGCALRGTGRKKSPAHPQDTSLPVRTHALARGLWMGGRHHTCWAVACLVSCTGQWLWRGHRGGPLCWGWGRSRRGTFKQHWWGCPGTSALPLVFWRLFQFMIHGRVFNPSVNKINVFFICKYRCTGQFWFLVPAGVVMPSSSRKDAPTQLTGLVWRQRTLDAIPERHSWHRQVTNITPWPAARSDPGMGTPCSASPCKLGRLNICSC